MLNMLSKLYEFGQENPRWRVQGVMKLNETANEYVDIKEFVHVDFMFPNPPKVQQCT